MENLKKYPDILTKENFWNELHEKYPSQMKVFCDWIDEYKKRVNWEYIFSHTNSEYTQYAGFSLRTPKFHEIPIAMQIGIIVEFSMSLEDDSEELKSEVVDSIEALIKRIKF